MSTGRIVRDPPAEKFVSILTFDESHSLVSMDTEAPINIRFNSTEPRPQGQFLICYGLEESPNHGPTNENNSRIVRTDDEDQQFSEESDPNPISVQSNLMESDLDPNTSHERTDLNTIRIVSTNCAALMDNRKKTFICKCNFTYFV